MEHRRLLLSPWEFGFEIKILQYPVLERIIFYETNSYVLSYYRGIKKNEVF